MKKIILCCIVVLGFIGYVRADDSADISSGAPSNPFGGGGIGSLSGGIGTGSDFLSGGSNNSNNNGDSNTNNSMLGSNGGALQSAQQFGQSTQIVGSDITPVQTLGDNKLIRSGNNISVLSGNNTNPLQPDEFQLNVQTRTGIMFKRYGYDLFSDPTTFAPISDLPASNNYILGPGDQVSIKAWGSIDIAYTAQVEKDGSIFIPKVGQVSLVGVKASNLESYLKAKIGRIYRNFSLSANVSKISSIQVNVAGFAKKPGTYTISSLSTLTNAVFASGGPSAQGSLRHIQLKRNGMVVADYDMYDLLLNGNDGSDIRLLSGDTIYIRPVGRQVAIYDGVKVPAIYEARENETVKDIVRFAGGYTFDNTKKQLIIEKISENKKIDVLSFDLAEGLKQPVENGEIIHFFKMSNRYNDAIVLIGNVANPSRFGWHNGITVKDIIPNKEVLLTKSFWNSYSSNTYAKDNVLQLFGKEKTNNWSSKDTTKSQFSSGLNSTAPDSNGGDNAFGGGDNLFTAGPISIPEADINWHYAVVVRINPNTYRSELIPFDLESAIAGDPKNNLKLQPGDIVNVLSAKDVRNPSKKGVLYVFIDGEVNRPGIYELKPGCKLIDAIKTAGGLTPEAYLYGLELDRQSVKKRQKAALSQMLDNVQQTILSQATNAVQSTAGTPGSNANVMPQIISQQQAFIDKLRQVTPSGRIVLGLSDSDVNLDTLPNLNLDNGDTIYVPSMPTTVDVIGQVYNPATFAYSKHNTLGDYINKAGTPNDFADTSSIYVLHADGTLYSKQQAGWYSAFNSKHLYPGDVIVVPQTVQFTTLTTNVINWTQILANFGLGIAAIRQLQ